MNWFKINFDPYEDEQQKNHRKKNQIDRFVLIFLSLKSAFPGE